MPRWILALAMLLNVAAGGMPMAAAGGAAITDPVAVALALANPDLCHTPQPGEPPGRSLPHAHDCLLCPVCLAHGAITASAPPLLPGAPTRLAGRVGPARPGALPAGPAREGARARGPPATSA